LKTTLAQGITIDADVVFTIFFTQASTSQVFPNATSVLGLDGSQRKQSEAQEGK
jgi:hypothetical protein